MPQLYPTEVRILEDGACFVVQAEETTLELDLLTSVDLNGQPYFVFRAWSMREAEADEYDVWVFSAHDVEDVPTVQLGVVDDETVDAVLAIALPDAITEEA